MTLGIEPEFDAFWRAYPRRKNKIAARDAFRWALLKTAGTTEPLLAALRWQINQDRRAFEQKVACQMRGLYRPPQYG